MVEVFNWLVLSLHRMEYHLYITAVLQKNESCGQIARRTHFCMGNIWDSLMSIEEIYELAMRPVLSLYNILIALVINS